MSRKKKFFKDTLYIAAAKYSGIIISILITSILARILTPEDYGIITIATVFIVFFTMLGDMGLGPAIIQFKELTRDDIKSIFGLSLWIGAMLSGLFYLCSGWIASFYEERVLVPVCQILSLQIFFTVLNIVPNALLSKDKKFKIIALRNVTIQISCGVLAIVAAYHGAGVYSLLIAPVLGSIVTFAVNELFMKLGINLIPSLLSIKKIFNFSAYQFLFGFINYFNRNLDKFVIGKYINISQLGYYEKSYRLMMMPIQNINGVLTPVLHPYLSDSQNNLEKLKSIYFKMTRILINLSCILAALLYITANEIIIIIYGDQWLPAIPYFRILSISVISQITSVSIGAFMQSCYKTKVMFYLGTINTIVFITLLMLSLTMFHDTKAICIAFVIAFFIEAINSFYAVSKYCFNIPFLHIMQVMIKPICFYLTSILGYYALIHLITDWPFISVLSIKLSYWLILSFCYLQYLSEYKPIDILHRIISKRKG